MFCRVCLAENVKMHTVIDTPLQELYEKITDAKLTTSEGKPTVICYMCHALLRKCQMFQRTAKRSNAVLLQLCFDGTTTLSATKLSNFNRPTLHNYIATPIEFINLYNTAECVWSKQDGDSASYETDRDGVKDDMVDSVKEESSLEEESNEMEFTSDQSKTSTPSDSDDDVPLKMLRTRPLRKRRKQNTYKEETRQTKAKDQELDCQITNLTPAEQEAAMQERATSLNYQNSVYKCSLCYRGFLTPHAYSNHMEKHDESNGEYACELCALRYRSLRLLRAHKYAAHERLYTCNKCTHTSLTRNQASDHERLHSGEYYECKLCNKTFHARTSYLSHMRAQHPAQPKLTVCLTCGERFVSEHGLRMHRAKSHKDIHVGGGEEAAQESSQLPSAPREGFMCKECGEALISEQELRAHKELKHNKPDSPVDRYCSHCDIQFATRKAWINHVLITRAHRQLAIYNKYCPICKLYIHNGIHNHMRHHELTSKKPAQVPSPPAGPRLACDKCSLSFANKARLTAHVRRIHLGLKYNKNLVCELCGKRCTSAATLRYHQRTHTGERPHLCTVPTCGKRFADTNQLRIHQRTHTGERPYSCDRCGKRFAQKPALNRHYRVHTGAKPYSCDVCAKSFSQSNSRNTHVKAVHLKMPSYRRLKSRSTYVRKNTSNEIRKNEPDGDGMNELTSHVKMIAGDVNSHMTLEDCQLTSSVKIDRNT